MTPVAVGGGGSTGCDYAAEVLSDAPLGYWRLDESTRPAAHDASENGNEGTFTGVTLGEPGAVADVPEQFYIGNARNWTNFKGVIDEVAVYDHPLAEARVTAHYACATTGRVP